MRREKDKIYETEQKKLKKKKKQGQRENSPEQYKP